MRIRDATVDDMPSVCGLYNALINTTSIAWTEHEETLQQRLEWFGRQQHLGYPVLVADNGSEVIGFAALGDFRDSQKWPGYRFVVEQTVHVREDHWGRGVGRALIAELVERARELGKVVVVAGIDGANEASIRFHERLGFVEVARLPGIGFKFDQWLDLVLMQRATTCGLAR